MKLWNLHYFGVIHVNPRPNLCGPCLVSSFFIFMTTFLALAPIDCQTIPLLTKTGKDVVFFLFEMLVGIRCSFVVHIKYRTRVINGQWSLMGINGD